VPWGLLCRAGRPGACRSRPGFPWVSLVFLFCSFGASAGGLEWNASHRSAAFAQVIPVGAGPCQGLGLRREALLFEWR